VVVTIINNKGGTGKTTTSVNLGAALSKLGYRILLIDMDPQASASFSLGVGREELSPGLADVMFDSVPVVDAVHRTSVPRLHLLTGEMELANSDLILGEEDDGRFRLKRTLHAVRGNYDFVLCDCPPSLSLLPVNALTASDAFIVTMLPEYLAYEGLIGLMEMVSAVKNGLSVNPVLLGILFTMVSTASRLRQEYKTGLEVIQKVREQYGETVFRRIIRRDPVLSEAPSAGQSVFDFRPGTRGAKEYRFLVAEFLERCGIDGREAIKRL